jgi:hypothetical protein
MPHTRSSGASPSRAAAAWSPQIPGPEAGSGQLTRKNAFGRARAACTAASGNVLNLPFQGPVLAAHAEGQEWQATFATHGEIPRGASWFTTRRIGAASRWRVRRGRAAQNGQFWCCLPGSRAQRGVSRFLLLGGRAGGGVVVEAEGAGDDRCGGCERHLTQGARGTGRGLLRTRLAQFFPHGAGPNGPGGEQCPGLS